MSNNFRYQPFVAVSGNPGEKVQTVDDVLASHEQQIHSTSLDKNCIQFEFQMAPNYYVDLRQTYFALKFVKSRGHQTYNTEEVKKEHKEEAKADEETAAEEEQEAPVPLVTHVNDILHSIFPNVEVYINNQQMYNPNGLHAHKSYISNNFRGTLFEYKGVLQCKECDFEEFPD